MWRKLRDTAERELHDSGVLRAQLASLKRELEDGYVDTEGVRTGKRKGCSTG
ncbi:gas vesicle protein GvpG [Streptomyces sp. NBC_00378]|uniref:gas vesicle protein GvpG n=1 Tax=unclassified Streptomyces TaxID=2593676 RepID=UPI00224F32BC|nr:MULTISPECIES: gas vesicle protein GvpG [unclassified Streptomyces]MCX5113513.1 gas vesicle protein GvpG [Streptomyces sp. NBC_00378]